MSRFLIVDGNNIAFVAQSSSKMNLGGQEGQSVYHVFRILKNLKYKYGSTKIIVLWDGYSWRKNVVKDYKKSRDEIRYVSDIKRIEERKKLNESRPDIEKMISDLGIMQARASNMEADDLVGIYLDKLKYTSALMVTADKDWLQLIRPKVGWFDVVRNRNVTLKNFEEFTTYKKPSQFLEARALIGTSAKGEIPGVKGIGEKKAKAIIDRFDSVGEFLDYCAVNGADEFDKLTANFATDSALVEQWKNNMQLMNLAKSTLRPEPKKHKLTRGCFSPNEVYNMCDQYGFTDIMRNFDQWVSPFKG